MAKQNKQKFELTQFDPNQIIDFSSWEKRQHELVKEHPFVAIEDRETYETAKANRTALVTGRTDLQKERDAVKKELNGIKKFVVDKYDEFIDISKPAEEKQQAEVKRHEAILEAEKEKERELEEKRANGIRSQIADIDSNMVDVIQQMTVDAVNESRVMMAQLIADAKQQSFNEFTFMLNENIERREKEFIDRANQLQIDEQRRLDDLKIQRQSLINEMFVRATKAIDAMTTINVTDARVIIDDIFTMDMEFGEFEQQYHDTWNEMIDRAKAKAKQLERDHQEQQERAKANEMKIQENRIHEIEQGLLDMIHQMDGSSMDDDRKLITDKMVPSDKLFPELASVWTAMTNRVTRQLESKVENIELKNQIENQRWNVRKPQCDQLGFEFLENEGRFRHPATNEIWFRSKFVVETGDASWKSFIEGITNDLNKIFDENRKNRDRQDSLAGDKKELIRRIQQNEFTLKTEGIQNDEIAELTVDIRKEFDQWIQTMVQKIETF